MKIFKLGMLAVLLAASPVTLSETRVQEKETSAQATAEAPLEAPLTLYNFSVEEDEVISNPHEMTVDKGKEFIPPMPVAEQLYLSYVKQGAKPLEAITYTYVELRKALSELEADTE